MSISYLQNTLLQILSSGPNYGLKLIDKVAEIKGAPVYLLFGSFGRIYPALRKMERRGLVEHYKDFEYSDKRRGRPRIYYCITDIGLEAIEW